MTTAGPRVSAAPAKAAEKCVPSADSSSRTSAAAPPARRGMSSGRSGGTASNSKHMPDEARSSIVQPAFEQPKERAGWVDVDPEAVVTAGSCLRDDRGAA